MGKIEGLREINKIDTSICHYFSFGVGYSITLIRQF